MPMITSFTDFFSQFSSSKYSSPVIGLNPIIGQQIFLYTLIEKRINKNTRWPFFSGTIVDKWKIAGWREM